MRYGYPDTHVLYRDLARDYPLIVHGEGCWLVDRNGRRYLDACGGAYVACLGHGVPEVVEAVTEQIRRVAYVSGMSFTNEAAESLADELASLTLGDLDQFYFLSSGSDAIEAALKLARQYWVERGRPAKSALVAQAPGYHGNTLLALSAGGRGHPRGPFEAWRGGGAREHSRRLLEPWLVDVTRVPAPYPYRCPCRGEGPSCPRCSGRALQRGQD